MTKQPFYHRVEGALLFTATRPISEKEFIAALERGLKSCGLVKNSVEIECLNVDGKLVSGYCDAEPGDPDDL